MNMQPHFAKLHSLSRSLFGAVALAGNQIALSVGISAAGVPAAGWGWVPLLTGVAVVDAVREDRFWVLPQPEVAYGALDRVQRIVDGRPPVDLAG